MNLRHVSLAVLAIVPGPAFAGETILYQAHPDWVKEASLPVDQPSSASPFLVFDLQQRVDNGQLWQYQDTAVKITSPEMLAQFSTVAAQWSPHKGDLIVHDVSIRRDGETIDLLAKGMKLEVLRREELLEQRQLTGILSATAAIEGLRVGDVFRLRYSVTVRDKVLGERVQSTIGLPASPFRLGMGRVRAIWPVSEQSKWQVLAKGVAANPTRHGQMVELEFPLPVPKQPEMPQDAPARFQPLPIFELSTFRDWEEVSHTFAPLYQGKGRITDGSPLATEADKIAAATQEPLKRTQAALQLVQDQVRYLALSMNAGNYTPQEPDETWKLRYGDCKAKSLMLLALLDRLGIKAEAVLANTQNGHALLRRLPSAGAFDHVLVRAEVGGQTLWLDGTGIGTRLEDIHDTPDLGYVLPLRTTGGAPEMLVTHANARPAVEVSIDYDESTSYDLPSVANATVTFRGPLALGIGLAVNALAPDQRDEFIHQQMQKMIGEGQYTDLSVETSTENATAVFKGRGILTTMWRARERTRVRGLSTPLSNFTFAPDRARAEWRDIPVATRPPIAAVYDVRIHLPDGGRGYTMEGAADFDTTLGGTRFVSHAGLAGDIFSLDERSESTGAEVSAAQIAADRAGLAKAQAQVVQVVAPTNATRRWELARAAKGSTQIAAINAILSANMAKKEPTADPWIARASLRKGTGDYKGAQADLTHAITLSADADTYLQRSSVNRGLGDIPAAIADARKALELDPALDRATHTLATLLAEKGDLEESGSLLDEKIALGGDNSRYWEMGKVESLGLYGDSGEALKLLDGMMEKRPHSSDLLNLACWIKGMRGVDVDNAMHQCASAIELSASPSGPLDSRAVVWFRLGRYDDALRDLDAVLRDAPSQAPSRYMRGIVLAHLGREAESKNELAIARKLDPGVDTLYIHVGIKP